MATAVALQGPTEIPVPVDMASHSPSEPTDPTNDMLDLHLLTTTTDTTEPTTWEQLDEANSQLSPQDSESDFITYVQRQNAVWNADPKSIVALQNTQLKECDLWQGLVDDYATNALRYSRLFTAELRTHGVPQRLRGELWQSMSRATDTHLETMYDRLIQDESPYGSVIDRDVKNHTKNEALGRLLKAYSVYDAHVGYCQGLAYLANPLLATMPEKQAFCVFVRLMELYDMRTLFMLNMEGLHLRLHQFQTLLGQRCPQLEAHLNTLSIHPAMYASQWYLTLFAQHFPENAVMRIYDLALAQGVPTTVTRIGLALLQKNQDRLLAIDNFEQLLLLIRSPDLLYDINALIGDAMKMSGMAEKMARIADTHQKGLEQEKERAHQVLAVRFGQKPSKRDSWFSFPSTANDRTALMHQQIEDLVATLTQLQQDHSDLANEMAAVKLRDVDEQLQRDTLNRRNAVLEQRLRKCKQKLALSQAQQREAYKQGGYEYDLFVQSLRTSGQFGALVAGALTLTPATEGGESTGDDDESEEDTERGVLEAVVVDADYVDDEDEEVRRVTAEAAELKRAYEEMEEKYEAQCQKYENLREQCEAAEANQEALIKKNESLQGEIDLLELEREKMVLEIESVLKENEEVVERNMACKKTAAELQIEKMELANDVERQDRRIRELEQEKREYLMPRRTFSEEVFAAHQVLFGDKESGVQLSSAGARVLGQPFQKKDLSRRHTLQLGRTCVVLPEHHPGGDYQAKYVESELRCRELEKLLAETKVKLAEHEAAAQHQTAMQMKRSSTASFSMLAHHRSRDERRESTDSFASSVTSATSLGSQTNVKRSSMYARLWNTFGPAQVGSKPELFEGSKPELFEGSKPELFEEPTELNSRELAL
ncbi:hypothetical protein DFQ28_008298 [Apophysomyces sp. BC1034]|nr:hypothetical protein DFQ30_007156 [Apophysomyces sp. BC1015]KAG0181906.1 hypothetical protein DFQ29_006572 [Apophysomyces sp. BC1021]KAG0192675.1 hypothetical protein DFQ28_008298 [Apophysomyces sp. BC1034]